MRHPIRAPVLLWSCVLLALGTAAAWRTAAAQEHCRVQLAQGWHTGAGTARIVMKNNGKPCGGTLYAVPQQSIPVDKITVLVLPKNGEVVVAVPRFAYTPSGGFVGEDRFELGAEGPERSRGRVTLRGTVFVRVEP